MLKRKSRGNLLFRQRPKLPRDGAVIAALDIGAAKTICFIARVTPIGDGTIDFDIIGAGHSGANLSPSVSEQSNNDHSPTNSLSFARQENAVRSAVEAAERMAGERIHDVHVCVPGHALQCRYVGIDLALAGGVVTADDIADTLAEGSVLITPDGYKALHISPKGYVIDQEHVGTDPRGLQGELLTTHMLGVHASENTISNLSAIVESAGLSVASCLPAPLMAAHAALVDDEKDLGVLMIDIGARGLSYAVYQDGRPTGCGGIIPGAAHISRDLAHAFSTPIAQAERQKILHGTVLSGIGDEHRFVEMPSMVPDEPKTRVSRADITSVILPRVEELYEKLIEKIVMDQCSVDQLRRVVLTGGGSQLDGVREHTEQVFAMKARLGKPIYMSGAPEALTGAAFSACAGALHYTAEAYGVNHDYPEIATSGSGVQLHGSNKVVSWLKARF